MTNLPILLHIKHGIITARINPNNTSIIIRDYDVEGIPNDELNIDSDGVQYIEYRLNDE